MDVPLGTLPGVTEIDKGDTNGLIYIVFHEIFTVGLSLFCQER